jgi:elongation factor 1-gamma
MPLKLYTYPNNARAAKALIAAQYAGVQVDIASDFVMGKTNKTTEFLALNPLGKVPTLEVTDAKGNKTGVFESNAIARYVARVGKKANNLFGATAEEEGQINAFIDLTVGEIDMPAAAWLYPIKGYIPQNEAATKAAKKDIRGALTTLNNHLATRTFLVGERISLADIVVACSLHDLYVHVLDNGFRKQFVHTNRWFATLTAQAEFRAVLGDVELCAKMAVAPVPEKKAAPAKKEAKKKEAKKAAEPAAEPAPKKEKAKNPLDLLPASSFSLEEWKRVYSNESDTRGKAVPWFWENFDAEGYSIWFADYKYNSDNKKLFMTNNLLGGWLQRLDHLRKYAFGVLLIFGDASDPNFDIHTAWVFRGQDIPFEMKDSPDFESYDFHKWDGSDQEKNLFNDFVCWDGEFKGLPTDKKCKDNGKDLK